MADQEKKKVRYVVTQYGCDWDYNFCTGVYDNPIAAYGHILQSIHEGMYEDGDKEVRIRFEDDPNAGSFCDVICTKPKNENHSELEDGYRVYFLRDGDDQEGENGW